MNIERGNIDHTASQEAEIRLRRISWGNVIFIVDDGCVGFLDENEWIID